VGKTQIIKALATEAETVSFLNVKLDMIMSKWLGETEKSIRALFDIAREKSPAIIFIDEVDALCGARTDGESECTRRLKNALLTEMDGLDSNRGTVTVIGNTNQPQLVDKAFMRRFPKRVYVPLPSKRDRERIICQALRPYDTDISPKGFEILGSKTHG
jgi:SpoVK/Ycf46/Vps4 family AAA+-type ATPase